MTTLRQSVMRFSDRYDLLPPNACIVVAVSGGPDSLCLLHLLHTELAPRRALHIHAAHLDHQLRPDSADDARFVAHTAQVWGVPYTLGTADVAALARATHTGLEAAGRTARYGFLLRVAREVGAVRIALGHTADDQAETVLLRVLRGAGVGGLAAMRPTRPAVDPAHPDEPPRQIVRPLLDTLRAQVEAYCAEHDLQPRRDPTNESGPFLRNRVRDHILPLLKTYNPSIVATLGRAARVHAVDDDLLETLAAHAWQQAAQITDGTVVFNRQAFEAVHPALQRRLLRRGVQTLRSSVELQAHHIDAALDTIGAGRRRMQLPGGLWLQITPALIRIVGGT